MERTENLGLHLPTFEDKADVRLIANDNQKIDLEAKRLNDVKANKDSVYTKEEIGDPALLAKLSEKGATNWDSENFNPDVKANKAEVDDWAMIVNDIGETLTPIPVSIPVNLWTESTEVEGYKLQATVTASTVTTNDDLDIRLDPDSVVLAQRASVLSGGKTNQGSFTVYAKRVPGGDLVGRYTIVRGDA